MAEAFIMHDEKFKKILGKNPSLELLAEKDYAFAHEAGVFIPSTNALFITSNRLEDENGTAFVEITKVSIGNSAANTICTIVPWKDGQNSIFMANGGVNYKNNKILFCAQGHGEHLSGIFSMSISPPYTKKTIVTSFYGRPFNSTNDVVVHSDGSIWFTDPSYGFEQGYRQKPSLPDQVYRYDPVSGNIRVVSDGFVHPNGICFAPGETIVYITDTGAVNGNGTIDYSNPSTIYAYDVVQYSKQPFLTNRRVFAMTSYGIPDGIKCDVAGNVYSGCGNGLHVWSPGGILLGIIHLEGGIANFCFGRAGEIFLMNETKLWRVRISNQITGDLLKL